MSNINKTKESTTVLFVTGHQYFMLQTGSVNTVIPSYKYYKLTYVVLMVEIRWK